MDHNITIDLWACEEGMKNEYNHCDQEASST